MGGGWGVAAYVDEIALDGDVMGWAVGGVRGLDLPGVGDVGVVEEEGFVCGCAVGRQ